MTLLDTLAVPLMGECLEQLPSEAPFDVAALAFPEVNT